MTIIYAKPDRQMPIQNSSLRLLEFGDTSLCSPGAWRVVGGLSWPDPKTLTDGVALVLGWEKTTGAVHVLAEHGFSVIDPSADNQYPDMAGFINKTFAAYGCDSYAWMGNEIDRYADTRRVIESKIINPTPDLPHIAWMRDVEASAMVIHFDQAGQLFSHADGSVSEGLRIYQATREMTPALRALGAGLAMIESEAEPSYPTARQSRFAAVSVGKPGWEGLL